MEKNDHELNKSDELCEEIKLYLLFHNHLPIELKLIILDYYNDNYWKYFESSKKTDRNINTFKFINVCDTNFL